MTRDPRFWMLVTAGLCLLIAIVTVRCQRGEP